MRLNVPTMLATTSVLLLLTAPTPALASYMGPGLGLGVVSTALAVVGAFVMALIAIVWYPVKRALRSLRRHQAR
jgi:Na+-driven multidrug efflux pump